MKKKLFLFLTCTFVFIFSNACLAEYSYYGKWILFGKNNEYMIFCPTFLFDNVEDDPYAMGEYGVYLKVQTPESVFLSATDGDTMVAYADDISTNSEEEVIKNLEGKEFICSREEQYGISYIKAINYDEIAEDVPSYIEDYYILDGERIDCWVRFFYYTDKERFEKVPPLADEIFSTIQPVNGSREEIGQYKMYKKIRYDEEGEQEEDITDNISVLTLAEDGEGYLWLKNRGYELYDWDVTDGNLTMSNFDLEGYYQDGEMVLDDGKVKLYFKKSNEHLIYPYHEEE